MGEDKVICMFNFPLFLDIKGKRVVVVGGGNVALRKIEKLLAYSADVTIVSPELHPFLWKEWERGAVQWVRDRLRAEHLSDAFLIISASGSEEAQDIIKNSSRADQLINGADNPQIGNVAFPAIVQEKGIHLAISSGGKDPALVKELRKELERWL